MDFIFVVNKTPDMVLIDIVDCAGYTDQDFLKMLIENDNKYEIGFPKSTQQFFSERTAIADDYIMGAFAAQELAGVAEWFDYNCPTPDEHESFIFSLKPKNKEALAKILSFLAGGIHGVEDDEEFGVEFWDSIEDFIEKAKNIELACPEAYGYYLEFTKEDDADMEG